MEIPILIPEDSIKVTPSRRTFLKIFLDSVLRRNRPSSKKSTAEGASTVYVHRFLRKAVKEAVL